MLRGNWFEFRYDIITSFFIDSFLISSCVAFFSLEYQSFSNWELTVSVYKIDLQLFEVRSVVSKK